MIEERIGMENNEIKLIKKNDELVSKIMEQRKLSEDKAQLVKSMMRYNMWTMKQFCDLTGYKESTVTNLTRPSYNKNNDVITQLDFCYPLRSLDRKGPKFIVRNEKSEQFLPKVD
jgi:hypothetical protein